MSVLDDLRQKCHNFIDYVSREEILTDGSFDALVAGHYPYHHATDIPTEVIAQWLSTFYGKVLPRFGIIIKKEVLIRKGLPGKQEYQEYVMKPEQVHEYIVSQCDGFISSNLLKLKGIEINQALFTKSGENFEIADKLRKYMDYFASMCDLFLSADQKEEAIKPEEPVEEKEIVKPLEIYEKGVKELSLRDQEKTQKTLTEVEFPDYQYPKYYRAPGEDSEIEEEYSDSEEEDIEEDRENDGWGPED